MKKILALVVFLASLGIANASYCDLNLHPKVWILENGTVVSAFNLTKFNQTFYNYTEWDNSTNVTRTFFVELECNQSKTFFVLPETEQTISVEPNKTVNISFTISPVHFGTYTIKTWGIFGDGEETVEINEPYVYNTTTKTFPVAPTGLYAQAFEISNGLETRYLVFYFKNTVNPIPEILDANYPNRIKYGKSYEISVLTKNANETYVVLLDSDNATVKTVVLERKSEDYWKGKFAVNKEISYLKIVAKNKWKKTEKVFRIATEKLTFSSRTVLLPAVPINSTSKILLINFSVETPLKISLNSSKIGNSSFSYSITNEAGAPYPGYAKELYLYLTPNSAEEGKINVTISSDQFNPFYILVDFMPSKKSYPNQLNITYYGHETTCVLKGDNLLDSKYYCYFTLPYNIDPSNLQSVEVQMLKDSYEQRINELEGKISHLKQMLIAFAVFVAVLVGLGTAYKYRAYLFALMGSWGRK